jgi:hypothetical protein
VSNLLHQAPKAARAPSPVPSQRPGDRASPAADFAEARSPVGSWRRIAAALEHPRATRWQPWQPSAAPLVTDGAVAGLIAADIANNTLHPAFRLRPYLWILAQPPNATLLSAPHCSCHSISWFGTSVPFLPISPIAVNEFLDSGALMKKDECAMVTQGGCSSVDRVPGRGCVPVCLALALMSYSHRFAHHVHRCTLITGEGLMHNSLASASTCLATLIRLITTVSHTSCHAFHMCLLMSKTVHLYLYLEKCSYKESLLII